MKRYALAAAITALTGCMVGPDYQPPQTAAPEHWHTVLPQTSRQPQDLTQWWTLFNDPLLTALINEAMTANPELKQAIERVVETRIQRTAVIAAALPSLSARSNVNRRLNNTSTSSLGQGSTGASSSGGFGVGNQVMNIFQLGFDAQWELDFFGGVRRALEAADATIEVEEANRFALQTTLLAEVATHYVSLRENQRRLETTEAQWLLQRDLVSLVAARLASGLATELELAQAKAQASRIEAQIPLLRAAAQQHIHALSVLLGKQPTDLLPRLQIQAQIPQASGGLVNELPSELLRRRPDIRQAERQLAVANAQIGIAEAELYPKVNLAAFLGLQNTRLTDFTPLGKSWSTAASLSMPLFNWGKLQANIKTKESQFEQARLAYETTVLNAFKEVEDALVAYIQEQRRQTALTDTVKATQLATNLANERYQKGLIAFSEVLDNQADGLQAQQDLTVCEARLAQHLIALYKALGGGWQAGNTVDKQPNG